MRYKREDSFRYAFDKPLEALFRIERVDGDEVTTSMGKAQIIDISPTGLKLNTDLEIPQTEQKDIELSISFTLNGESFEVTGEVVWKKEAVGFDYGIDLSISEEESESLVEAVKKHANPE